MLKAVVWLVTGAVFITLAISGKSMRSRGIARRAIAAICGAVLLVLSALEFAASR